ncbi:MAG: hypothetical protein Q8R82_05485 [Hyphomonadaceae bacterium]|nr:hypothetical protein [Hyphomonadaceae bacterium]
MRLTWAVITTLACIAVLAAPILAQSPMVESTTIHLAKSFGITLEPEARDDATLTSATFSE